ncbi:MAG: RnfABCDGE type electron transport complex subunit G [Rikenellaceae bacterium]|nr:RnfABCDGE type electron transport complex subunit G [Rikenellaceae bacterium]
MKSSLKNMVMVLFLITLICSAAIGGIYELTKDPIDAAKQAKTTAAISEVLPSFDRVENPEVRDVDGDKMKIYKAVTGNEITGYAIETFSKKGFGGTIRIMVGFKPDGTICGTSVISHSETPGLGDKIDKSKSDFSRQFEGKNPATFRLGVKKDGAGDVDAITASTISSRAFTDAVKRAYEEMKSYIK